MKKLFIESILPLIMVELEIIEKCSIEKKIYQTIKKHLN